MRRGAGGNPVKRIAVAACIAALVAGVALTRVARQARSSTTPSTAEATATFGASSTTRATEPIATPGTFDARPYRDAARVPAIAYAALTRDGEAIVGATGLADVERGVTATVETPFEAASIAKTIIATCVMQLVERSRCALDEDVSSYVGFRVHHPASATPITLRMLLTHTASIHDRLGETAAPGGVPLGDFLRPYLTDGARAKGTAFLDAAPGSTMEYSNVGASLAAFVVERLAGVPFAEHAQRTVFDPLGMTRTAFVNPRADAARPAIPHAARDGGFARLERPSHALYPVVDLFASVKDLARFTRAILRGGELDGTRVLSSESVALMLAPQIPAAAPDEALGWQLRSLGGRRVAGHEGEDAGASTGLYVQRDEGLGAIVLANGDAFQGGDAARARAIGSLLEKLLEQSGGHHR